jgi:CO/xanthine dehydrogenase Mo-binding subunit
MPNEAWGVGASVLRREDERHLHGRGEFVSDIKLPGTMEVAFVRSPHAHARIKAIAVPPEAAGRVFTAVELPRLARTHGPPARSACVTCSDTGASDPSQGQS